MTGNAEVRPEGVELLGRPTTQRTEVLRALAECTDFVSAQALHATLVAAGSPVGLSTVYRTLAALTSVGRTEVVRDTRGERRYRYRPGSEHHHFLVCRRCGLSHPLDSAPVEAWTQQVADAYDFAGVQHTVELSSSCADCAAAERGNGLAPHR